MKKPNLAFDAPQSLTTGIGILCSKNLAKKPHNIMSAFSQFLSLPNTTQLRNYGRSFGVRWQSFIVRFWPKTDKRNELSDIVNYWYK